MVLVVVVAVLLAYLSVHQLQYHRLAAQPPQPQPPHVVVVGGICHDTLARHEPLADAQAIMGTSLLGIIEYRWGGVANNIATAAAIAYHATTSHQPTNQPPPSRAPVLLISAVGNDRTGHFYLNDTTLFVCGIRSESQTTTTTTTL
jgi:sugar/nucleoside kinase (ribokinase family)